MAYISTVLYETGGNLRIMSGSQLQEIQALAAYFYQQNPVETLSVVGSGGNLSPTMTDRRYQAGTAVFNGATSFASEAATPDISAIDETYDRVSKSRISSTTAVEPEENGTNTAFPIYWDGATKTIKTMTKTDFFDTFIGYTITNGLVGTSGISKLAAGTYTVLTASSSIAGNPGTSIVSTTPIFVDKRADADAYTAAGIEETQDQPEVINSYYLHKVQQTSKPTYQMPLFMRSDGSGVQVYTTANFENMIDEYIQSATFGLSGYSITHEIGTSVSNQKGSSINDTYLSGSSADGYTQYLATIDDYRTQEFPNGAVAILNSYKLGVSTASGYTVSANPTTANEGDTVVFTVDTVNVTPGNVPYTITGITADDLSSGSLTGNVTTSGTFGSATGTTSITLDSDALTEGTETIVFTAGGASVSVTVNDTSTNVFEVVSLEGTSGIPELSTSFPLSDGSVYQGWRFSSNGTVEDFDADRFPQLNSGGHTDWVNTSTPSTTYYIRATIDNDNTQGQSSQAGQPLNTWLSLASNRSFTFVDNTTSVSYGYRTLTYKIEISASSTGSDTVTGPFWQDYAPQTEWITTEVATNNWRYTVWWDGVMVYEQDGYATRDTATEITGSDGYTYTRVSSPTMIGGFSYGVTQTIPGILATGYYRNQYEGGA